MNFIDLSLFIYPFSWYLYVYSFTLAHSGQIVFEKRLFVFVYGYKQRKFKLFLLVSYKYFSLFVVTAAHICMHHIFAAFLIMNCERKCTSGSVSPALQLILHSYIINSTLSLAALRTLHVTRCVADHIEQHLHGYKSACLPRWILVGLFRDRVGFALICAAATSAFVRLYFPFSL